MTDPIEQDVAALKQEAETRRVAAQRAQAQAEAAEADYARLLARLQEEFGVSSIEEAEDLLSKIDTELQSEIASVREALAQTRRPEESS